MKTYFRVLAYLKPYSKYLIGFAISAILMAVFSSVSIALLDPVLKLLFTEEISSSEQAVQVDASFNIHNIKEAAYYLVNDVMQANGKKEALVTFIILIVSLNVLGNLFRFLANAFTAKFRTWAIYDFRKDLMNKLVSKNVSFLDKQRKGDLITRVTLDIDEVDRSVISSVSSLFKNPILITVYLVFLLQYSAKLTGIIFLVLPISAFFISIIGRSLKKNARDGQAALSQMIGIIEEGLGGMRVIKAFNAEGYIKMVFDKFHNSYRRLYQKQIIKIFMASPFSETTGVVAVGLILWFGGGLVFSGELEASGFMTYIFIFTQTLQPAKELSSSISKMYKGNASAERIFSLIDQKVEVKNKTKALSMTDFKECISFENIDFSYEKDRVLNNLNLQLEKGKFYALVGPSGCGKSTLIELLLRFYDPQKGSIKIDQTDIKELEIDSVRDKMAIVTQDPILFNDTIYSNISFGIQGVTEKDVIKASKIANADDFIRKLDHGYDTEIGDRGVLLSGGQRQRISIARAVLKDAPILLLDEATSALDAKSEQEVQRALDALMKSKTSLVVAHRLSTIQNADKIFVMDKGIIVESGTHQELQSKKGVYYKLSQIQQLNA